MPIGPKIPDEKADEPQKKGAPAEVHAGLLAHLLGPTPKIEPKVEPKAEAKPAAAEAKPAKKDKEEPTTFKVALEAGRGALSGLTGMLAIGDNHRTVNQIANNEGNAPGGAALSIAKNLYHIVSNPLETASALKTSAVQAGDTALHGTWKERSHLAGATLFNLGMVGLGTASTAGRVGAARETLALGEKAAGSTVVARGAMTEFKGLLGTTERTAVEAAVSKVVPEGLLSRGVARLETTPSLSTRVAGLFNREQASIPGDRKSVV